MDWALASWLGEVIANETHSCLSLNHPPKMNRPPKSFFFFYYFQKLVISKVGLGTRAWVMRCKPHAVLHPSDIPLLPNPLLLSKNNKGMCNLLIWF